MSALILDSGIGSARIIQRRVNPRAPTFEPQYPYYRLRAPDGRYLNIDGSDLTDGPHRYIGNLRQAKAMRRTRPLAAGCKLVAVQHKREA